MMQFDLFETDQPIANEKESPSVGTPASGVVIVPFPQQRNIGRARHVAQKLSERDGKSKESYWRRSCADLTSMLSKAGLGESEICKQISAFREAVGLELGRIAEDKSYRFSLEG